jgi:methionine synthase II (cobalamin-independent)
MASELTLECLAIGSLPCDSLDKAMDIVKKDFNNIPFWPQLTNISEKEDMIAQFSGDMPSFYSVSFPRFLEFVKLTKPRFAKGQITGPHTLSFRINSEKLPEILAQKAIWQIQQIKSVSPNTTPIIFIDEPSLGTILNVSPVEKIKYVSDKIKENGGISGLHCCGNCDWNIAIDAGVEIISFDAYTYGQTLGSEFKRFLARNGKIAWGIIPTKDVQAIENANLEKMIEIFESSVKNLTQKGIDEKIIIENSLITPSCGAGALSEELAEKAMDLTKQLSENRKELWRLNLQ